VTKVIPGLGLIVIAGLSNSSFALPLRYNRIWKWENTWLAFTVCCLGVFPWVLAWALVRGLPELLASLSPKDVAPAVLFGFLWGIAMVTFGLALDLLGISIVLPIVSGLTLVVGAFTPIITRNPEVLSMRPGIIMELSTVLLLGSLLLYGTAARQREGKQRSKRSTAGLALAVFTGVFGGMINVGFAFSERIVVQSQRLGNSPILSTYPVWAFLLTAGLVPNLIYCLYLLVTKGTTKLFTSPGTRMDCMRSALMAVLWLTATVSYGMSTTFLGKLGTSLGFLLYGAFSITFANLIGFKAGEWTGAPAPALRNFWTAMGLAIGSVGILASAR
jgi:hypothetical protein